MKRLISIILALFLAAITLPACKDNKNDLLFGTGANVLSLKGGDGAVVGGGNGGTFQMNIYDTTAAKIEQSGSIDTSIDTSAIERLISPSSLDFGSEGWEVTSNTTVYTYPSGTAGLADGEYYLHAGDSTLYKYDANSDTELVVTGIHVHRGVTLTFGLNNNYNWTGPSSGQNGYDIASISLPNDIWNEGTIKTMDLATGANDHLGVSTNLPDGTALDMGSMYINNNGVLLNDGAFVTRGTDTTETTGGYGGRINVYSFGAFVNRGSIDVSGGNGTDGGPAGGFSVNAQYGIGNTGPISAIGGAGSTGVGGSGSSITLQTWGYLAPLYNSGTLNSSGGNGGAGGGTAAGCWLINSWSGSMAGGGLVNTGRIIGNGGNGTVLGNGANGANYHWIAAAGANMKNTGAIEAKGGNGAGDRSDGGDGGQVTVSVGSANNLIGDPVASGDVQFGGSVSADGGTGDSGGNGGTFVVNQNSMSYWNNDFGGYYNPVLSGTIELIGYNTVDLKGGKGATDGGPGGYGELLWSWTNDPFNIGSFYNDTNFDMTGGQGMTGAGGSGGTFFAQINFDWAYYWQNWKPGTKSLPGLDKGGIENHGNITTKGGKGATSGGDSGYFTDSYWSGWVGSGNWINEDYSIWMIASGSIVNTGKLDASGGDATDPAGTGGWGNLIAIDAIGHNANSGSITTNGGYGPAEGGNAGWMYMWTQGGVVTNSATISANGGNANGTDGLGGSGNDILLWTTGMGVRKGSAPIISPLGTQNTGTLNVNGGTGGGGNGSDGTSYVDVQNPHGSLP